MVVTQLSNLMVTSIHWEINCNYIENKELKNNELTFIMCKHFMSSN